MSREDIHKLLGGYATDTLSEAERRALFEAALDDQELFDALAREQALRDVLRDPAARQEIIAALGPPRQTFPARAWNWLRRPATLAVAGGMAALLIVADLAWRSLRVPPPMMAKYITTPAPVFPPEISAPARQPLAPPALSQRPLSITPRLATNRPEPSLRTLDAVSNEPPAARETQAKSAMMSAKSRFAPMPVSKAVAGAAARPPIDYSLLLAGRGGTYAPVSPDATFHPGDLVRVQVAPGEAGFLNLFERDPTGGLTLLSRQAVEKGQHYVLPSSGGLESDKPAQLELLLVLDPYPQAPGPPRNSSDNGQLAQPAGASIQKLKLEFR